MPNDQPEEIRRVFGAFEEVVIPRRGKTTIVLRQVADPLGDPRKPGAGTLEIKIGNRVDRLDRKHVRTLAKLMAKWLRTGRLHPKF